MTGPSLPSSENTLYLVDLSSFIFRAFFAIRSLHSPSGEPVNAVYGVTAMLGRILDEAKPQHLVLVRDSKEPSFRKEIFEDYKANRSEPPEDLIPQFARIDELMSALKFPVSQKPGFEADDLIATLTKKWISLSKKNHVVIVSNDKDLSALCSDRILIWDTMNAKVSGPSEVKEKFGVLPSQIADYLAIAGDSSDNIPGVKGLGPKAAQVLLTEWGSVEKALEAAATGKVSGKRGELLNQFSKEALISKKLTTLHEEVPISEVSEGDFKFSPFLTDEARALFTTLGFKSLIEKWSKYQSVEGNALPSDEEKTPAIDADSSKFKLVQSEEGFDSILLEIKKKGEFAIDLETTSLNPREAKIVGVALATSGECGYYVPIGHEGENAKNLNSKAVLSKLKPWVEDPRVKKIGQNLKYDFSVLMEMGWKPDGIGADTMVAAYALDASGRHNLEVLSERYLNHKVLTFEEVCGKGAKAIPFSQVSVETAARYSGEDAWCAFRLWEELLVKLKKENLLQVFSEIDLPLVMVIARMEEAGIKVNPARLQELKSEFEIERAEIEKKIFSFSGEPLNLNSPKQVGELLFEKLKLPVQSRTKTGPSTDASVLSQLSKLHEVPKLLLEYREISKLLGTYIDPLPDLIDKKTGRIHASFHLTGTATGRLSSSDPNLQNIPIRSKRGIKIRSAFVAEKGNVFISADYSQIELRILAHLSGDKELVRSFQEGEDVHLRTAAETLGKKIEDVTDQERSIAKAINFGLMYGKTAFGLAEELSIKRSEAKEFIDRYFTRYSGVKKYLDGQIALAKEVGFTTTLFGRKRALPDIRSSNAAVRANAERMAMNSPIQGTAADLMKIAMRRLDEVLTEKKLKSRLIVQVHDELLLECPKGEAEEVKAILSDAMENAAKLIVPLTVNIGSGLNWSEL